MNNKPNRLRLKLYHSIIGIVSLIVVIYLGIIANYEIVYRSLSKFDAMMVERYLNHSSLDHLKVVTRPEQMALLGGYLQRTHGNKQIQVFNQQKQLIWSSTETKFESKKQQQYLSKALQGKLQADLLLQPNVTRLNLLANTSGEQVGVEWYIPVFDRNTQNVLVVVVMSGKAKYLSGVVSTVAKKMLLVGFVSIICLFIIVYFMISHADKKINAQQQELKDQILRLSNLLAINKNMQKNMHSASSRAVELNEQFLRRVGSDLHDGPAQSIGYAVLRLDQVNQQSQSTVFNQEYHTVKEALASALEEIRGISSGLVLPELELLSLTESLKKVVKRHVKNSRVEVNEYYQNLSEEVPLPVQICAYRFVQESLNNVYRHGEASKCRLIAALSDGELRISLQDNGKGFRTNKVHSETTSQLGLLGLKDRVESLGGRFKLSSKLGVGSTIKMSIPLYKGS